ncbi:MAG: hypothetical protein HXY19_04710 [Thermoanaerobaculaceae bacterium]|nr:hypothetical protein [Thermoanaerobaculaceae bacterium]
MRRLQPIRVVGGAALLTALLVVVVTDQEQRHAQARSERRHLDMAARALAEDAARFLAADPVAADAEIRRWAAVSGLRVTLIRADGVVHADSWTVPGLLDRLENHGARPEVVAARRDGTGFARRRSVTTDRDTLYLARAIGPTDRPVGFLRLAIELEPPHRPWLAMGVAAVVAVGVALLARRRVQRFTRRVARRLGEWTDLPPDADLEALAEDADRHFRAERERLLRELDATRAALAEVSEGVILLDREGVVRFANPAASSHLGRPLAEGRPLLEFLRAPELVAAVEAVLASGGDRHTSCTDPRGPELAVRVCAVPHPLLAAAVVLRDVRGEKQTERARRALVADLAHELRTPLTVLGGLREELEEQGVAPQLLAALNRQVARLQAFARDLEDLSTIESGRLHLDVVPVELEGLVRQVLEDLGARAEAAGVMLRSTVAGIQLHTDPVRLAQVLANLVDNGIRYNRPGGSVSVEAVQEGEGVRLEVRDDGIGIPAAELPFVFQRFYRVRRGKYEDGGSGLGLAIVKHLVKALGGTVELTSREGAGTTVTVKLPLNRE